MSEITDVLDIINNNITSFTIPNSVKSIAAYTFYNCTSLQSVTFHSGITYFGTSAFDGCTSLQSVTLPEGAYFSSNVFSNTGLTELTIPENSVVYGSPFITNCPNLERITVKNGTCFLTSSANVTIASNCPALREIIFEPYVTSNNGISISSLPNLESVVLPKMSTFGSGSNGGGVYARDYLPKLTTLNLPDGVAAIADGACHGSTALTTINLPYSVSVINKNAFYGCTHITSLKIPNAVATIPQNMAYNCTGLLTVEIGFGVTTISAQAFYNCTSLTSIKFLGSTPPTVANVNAWTGIPTTCTIYVPTGSLSAYTSASNYPDPNTYTYVEY